jgi:ketosteroid isomerase-like protein
MDLPPAAAYDIGRVAAIVEIQQLAIRYTVGIDRRDVDMIAALFVPDVDCGHWGTGPQAFRTMYLENDSTFTASIHQTTNHLVNVESDDRASGTAYLHAEQKMHDGSWARLAGAYEDRYEKIDGRWLIRSRKLLFWYRDADAPTGLRDTTYRTFSKWPNLPEAWPTWEQFWADVHAAYGTEPRLHPGVKRSQEAMRGGQTSASTQ